MKIKNLALLFVSILLLSMIASLSAGTEQKTCPVTGGEINQSTYVDQDGKRIYVCCEGCIDEVSKNFSVYEQKLIDSGQTVALVTEKDTKDGCESSDCKTTKCDDECDGKIKAATAPQKSCSDTQANAPKKCCGSI
ncbi:MAG: hypothetical protein JXQ65_16710 [Candidatus Marinimicrobia bacterium]|nr:hypothetical protein [Candidatus Neomarinimicrobiota bacterium]